MTTLSDTHQNVSVVAHPLVQHHLSRLRDKATASKEFRDLVHRLTFLLAYEATRDLSVAPCQVQTPLAQCEGRALACKVALAPVMRAGLAMVDPVLHFIPEAAVWHLGFVRDEATALPIEYYAKKPQDAADVALALDPMLATGGSVSAAFEKLQDWKVGSIRLLCLIAAEDGVQVVRRRFPDVQIYTCAVDPTLNQDKFIVPGLGDAGDRLYGT